MPGHDHGHAFTFMNPRLRDGVVVHSRRSVLKTSLAGLGGLTLPGLMKLKAEGKSPKGGKSVILLWMTGGPSHIDTWDPKPGTPQGGPHKAIKTATPGLSISEHMPELAQWWAYPLVIVVMGTVATLLITYFRRRDWL